MAIPEPEVALLTRTGSLGNRLVSALVWLGRTEGQLDMSEQTLAPGTQTAEARKRPLIHSFGLFWERDKVDWGAGRRAGHLKGVDVKAKRGGELDFREQKGIYALYDHDFNLVYVGQVGGGNQTLLGRLRNHHRGQMRARWRYFSWFGTLAHTTEEGFRESEGKVTLSTALDGLEGIVIMTAYPLLNRQGARGSAKAWKEYTQWIKQEDEDDQMPIEERLKTIEKQLAALGVARQSG